MISIFIKYIIWYYYCMRQLHHTSYIIHLYQPLWCSNNLLLTSFWTSLQFLADERKVCVTKRFHRSWGLSLHYTDDIIPGAAHLQCSCSILNLSGDCSPPSPSKPLWLCIYSLQPLIHSKAREHCVPGGPPHPSHFPNLPFYPLFSFGQ